MIDIFTSNMFKGTALTESVRRLPNMYGRIKGMGLFVPKGVMHRSVGVEELNLAVNLLPTLPWGAPGTVGTPDKRGGYAFNIPHIPHVDAVTPEDVQSVREFGSEESMKSVAGVVADKLTRMRNAIDLTTEYMCATALAGTAKDGAGSTLYAYYTVFGITQTATDFVLGTATTDVLGKCMAVKRDIESKARGAMLTGIGCLCSSGFWDKLIGHAKVQDAFKYFQTSQPLSGDHRKGFTFGGITFEEYNTSVTLSDGSTAAPLITAGDAIFYPIGSPVGTLVFAPANYMDTVNTLGQPYYSKSELRKFGKGVDIEVQSNPLPILTRPDLVSRGYSSN